MADTFSMTQTLATFLGLYMLAAGVGLLVNRQAYETVIAELRANAALGYMTAILAFVIGAVIVALHNLWTGPTAIIVSVIGWAALIEGVAMLAVRDRFLALVGAIPLNPPVAVGLGAFTVVLGLWLLYAGLA
jgi:hypothetical protein